MQGQFIEVNYRNFEDAVEIADKRGDRIRMADVFNVQVYLRNNEIEPTPLMTKGISKPNSAMTIISKGLMEGIYVSWPDESEAWLYVNSDTPIKPLKKYENKMEYDLVLSYTFDQQDISTIENLSNELNQQGLNVYIIKHGENPNDPVWNIRFREAVFHGFYFIPYLSQSYLKGTGTIKELFDIARITVHHRETEYFYPMLPLVNGLNALKFDSLKQRNKEAFEYDSQGFNWLKTHMFPLDLNWGAKKITRFLSSLVQNYKNKTDYRYIQEISHLLKYVEFIELTSNGKRKVRIFLKHPNNEGSYYQFLLFNHGCNFIGLFEVNKQAKRVNNSGNIASEIELFLKNEKEFKPEPNESKYNDNIGDNLSNDSGVWLCVTCKYLGSPKLQLVKANPSVGIHEDSHIHVCPKCDGSMFKQ